jgi:hypothetical protein
METNFSLYSGKRLHLNQQISAPNCKIKDQGRDFPFEILRILPVRQDVPIPSDTLLCFRMKIRLDLRKDSALEFVSEYPPDRDREDG